MSCAIIRHNRPVPQIKKNFTIIEILIVIAIIVIISGMLLPTLAQAREKGKAISCVSNIRQLSTAPANYTSDYDGHFVPGKSDGAWGDANLKRWHGSRVNANSAFQSNGPLMYYLGNSQKVKECPNTPSINQTHCQELLKQAAVVTAITECSLVQEPMLVTGQKTVFKVQPNFHK